MGPKVSLRNGFVADSPGASFLKVHFVSSHGAEKSVAAAYVIVHPKFSKERPPGGRVAIDLMDPERKTGHDLAIISLKSAVPREVGFATTERPEDVFPYKYGNFALVGFGPDPRGILHARMWSIHYHFNASTSMSAVGLEVNAESFSGDSGGGVWTETPLGLRLIGAISGNIGGHGQPDITWISAPEIYKWIELVKLNFK